MRGLKSIRGTLFVPFPLLYLYCPYNHFLLHITPIVLSHSLQIYPHLHATMKSSTLFLKSALVAFAAGATLAPNLPDGFYHVYTDDNGLELHTQVTSAASNNIPLLSWTHHSSNTTYPNSAHPFRQPQNVENDLEKRCSTIPASGGEVWCGCTHPLVPSDCDAAVADLKNQVGSQPGGIILPKVGNAWYSIRGSVVAFQCPFTDQYLSALDVDKITNELATITNTCGRYIAGTIRAKVNGYNQNYDLGYMQYTANLDFCGADENSAQHCC